MSFVATAGKSYYIVDGYRASAGPFLSVGRRRGPAAKDRAKLRALVPACADAAAPPCSPTTATPRVR